ncbi:hypothetical protein B566_EDAN014412 [Ephemera danica]|nr:hypothetical protein B566_EDAN014412 [Ephemera danica]
MDTNYHYRMNAAAVKKVDRDMQSILDSASHVALYSFNSKENNWEKTSIEGAMFIYSRSADPQHAFIIMNRLSTENLIEHVNAGLDFQIKEPFLLYKTQQAMIYGIWFYDKNECYRITSNLQKLVKSLQTKDGKRKEGVGGVDIFSMLSKAQEDFNIRSQPEKAEGSKKSDTAPPPSAMVSTQALPIPNASNATTDHAQSTPQSVMDFFAKAGNTQFQAPDHETHKVMKPPAAMLPQFLQQAPAPNPAHVLVNPPPMPLAMASPQRSEDNMKPILMRIMSNPVHSVEHIEKQQRSVTPDSKSIDPHLENGIKYLRMSPVAPPPLFGSSPSTASETSPGWMLGMSPPAPMPIPIRLPALPVLPIQDTNLAAALDTELVPLTRNQLLQAITYLIKNDSEFVNKLHEAYVKSFNDHRS